MPFLTKILFCTLVFMTISVGVFAADIYVSTKGSDSNNGTKQFPFATFEQAQKEILNTVFENENENITIWISEGNYPIQTPLTFAGSDSGKIKNKVTYKALPGEKVQISGGVEIDGWKKNRNGIWEADLPENLSSSFKVRELFVNNERAVRARFPNGDFLRVKEVGEDKRTNFFFEKGDFPLLQQPENVELVLLHDWSVSRIQVKEINTTENKLTAVDSISNSIKN